MNTDKLCEILDRIFDAESKLATQDQLDRLRATLSNLAGDPQIPDFQNEMATAFQNFAESMTRFENFFSPRDYERVLELSEHSFSQGIVEEIRQSIQENVMSPNVVNELVEHRYNERTEVFSRLAEMKQALEYFAFGYTETERGQAEVGFQIPRGLFDNNLDGFIEELRDIRRMIEFFSEAALGRYEPVRVSSISTTDPLVFLVMAMLTAKYLAGSVTWALNVWRSVEEIRNIRAQTAKLKSFTPEEVEAIFEPKITAEIAAKTELKVKELIDNGAAPKDREGELAGRLTWALETLLAKTERGMTIEVRPPPPPIAENEEANEGADKDTTRQELLDIQKQLVFPEASQDPIL